jgi:hypothetical protein
MQSSAGTREGASHADAASRSVQEGMRWRIGLIRSSILVVCVSEHARSSTPWVAVLRWDKKQKRDLPTGSSSKQSDASRVVSCTICGHGLLSDRASDAASHSGRNLRPRHVSSRRCGSAIGARACGVVPHRCTTAQAEPWCDSLAARAAPLPAPDQSPPKSVNRQRRKCVISGGKESGRPGSNRRRPAWEADR